MIHTHYIKRRFLKPAYLFFIGVLLLFLGIGSCFLFGPVNWLIETAVVLLVGSGMVLLAASMPRYAKYAVILTVWLVVLLVLRRFDLLSWLSFAATLVLIGAATLFT